MPPVDYSAVMSAHYGAAAAQVYRAKFDEGDPTWDMIPAIAAALGLDGLSVLDVGCGPGINAEGLVGQLGVPRYVGIDASTHQIEAAKAALAAKKLTANVAFHCADACAPDAPSFADAPLETALASFVVPHLGSTGDIEALCSYCKTNTTPGAVTNIVVGDDYGVVRAAGVGAREAMFGPVCYRLPEEATEWTTGVKFDVVFAPDFVVPAYLWDVPDVEACAKAVFKHVEVVNAWDLTKHMNGRIPKEAAEPMFVLRCHD